MKIETAWVCVGTNTDGDINRPSWFYAFSSYEEADQFTELVRDTIEWEIYPCDLLTVDESVANVLEAQNSKE